MFWLTGIPKRGGLGHLHASGHPL